MVCMNNQPSHLILCDNNHMPNDYPPSSHNNQPSLAIRPSPHCSLQPTKVAPRAYIASKYFSAEMCISECSYMQLIPPFHKDVSLPKRVAIHGCAIHAVERDSQHQEWNRNLSLRPVGPNGGGCMTIGMLNSMDTNRNGHNVDPC